MAEVKETIDIGAEKRVATTDGSETSENREDGVADGINEGKLLRKIDLKLLPAVGILYLLSFLDRSNGTPLKYLCGQRSARRAPQADSCRSWQRQDRGSRSGHRDEFVSCAAPG